MFFKNGQLMSYTYFFCRNNLIRISENSEKKTSLLCILFNILGQKQSPQFQSLTFNRDKINSEGMILSNTLTINLLPENNLLFSVNAGSRAIQTVVSDEQFITPLVQSIEKLMQARLYLDLRNNRKEMEDSVRSISKELNSAITRFFLQNWEEEGEVLENFLKDVANSLDSVTHILEEVHASTNQKASINL